MKVIQLIFTILINNLLTLFKTDSQLDDNNLTTTDSTRPHHGNYFDNSSSRINQPRSPRQQHNVSPHSFLTTPHLPHSSPHRKQLSFSNSSGIFCTVNY